MKQNAAITVKNVTMKFKGQVVLNDINIDFEMGKIYGIIGRNGSGKTVLLKCICGLLLPTGGTVTVNDKKAVGKYSLGMRQRLGIAQALMENPDIIILDEPMNALDNVGVDEIRQVILKMRDRGKLIIIASHIREDIELLCDNVYEMNAGQIKDRTIA